MSPHCSLSQGLSIVNEKPSIIEGPDLLHNLVAPSSTAIAIDFLEDGSTRRKFSYQTLHTLSDALAQKISKSLEKLDYASSIVPVLLPQCPELYIVLLAILKAGRAFCPLSLDTPAERLNFILKDISADLLITNSLHDENLRIERNIIRLLVDKDVIEEDGRIPPTAPTVKANNLAYVLYTSGSTGVPKAVSVSHRAVTQSLLAHDRHIPQFSRFLQFAAPTFDVSVFEIFFPLYRACTLTSRTRANMLDNLTETIRLLDVDAAELTPTAVSNLLDGRSSVPSLRLLLTIGEMLTRDVIDEYGSTSNRDGILWAMYGPTEAAIHCTLQPLMPAHASTQNIGFPLDTVTAFVVAPLTDGESPSKFSILPIGEEGELALGGVQLADEYLNRPELNARTFIHHPKYGSVYRTGDRAKLRTDGTIECLGRVVKGQVKLRGQRIELGEIEQIIMAKVDGCRAATVMVIEDSLVAFYATGAREISVADILEACKQWLPQIMIPNKVISLQRMPQLPSGKIDRNALAALYHHELHRNEMQTKTSSRGQDHPLIDLLEVYLKQSLTSESILASVGLDSLRAIRLASELRYKGYQISTLQILSATTVGDLLEVFSNNEKTHSIDPSTEMSLASITVHDIPALSPWLTKVASILPCTPLQEAMLAETVARSTAYCNWIEVELSQPHSFERIEAALRRLAQANEILRSGFYPTELEEKSFVQVVWTGLEDAQIRHVREFSRTYSLNSDEALLRPMSVQVMVHPERPRLLFQIHHALYDGWSMDMMLLDLTEMLDGLDAKQRPQYRQLVQYQLAHRNTSQIEDELYWNNMLRGRPEVVLPNLNGRLVDNTKIRSVMGRSTVDLDKLRAHSRELMVSPQVYFQAAVAFVQSLYLGSSDIVIGNVTSGRTIPIAGIEDIIGPCIASLPFRLQFDQLTKVWDVLHATHRINRESLEHSSLSLRDIVKATKGYAGMSIFDVLFVWQESLHMTATSTTTSASIIDSADELEFKVTLEFEPRSDHILSRATFDPCTIPEHHVQYMCRQIDAVVELFLNEVHCPTTEIVKCFPTTLQAIANPMPQQTSLLHGPAHAVQHWASTTPNKNALVISHLVEGMMQAEEILTYATLNRRANQLARVLLGHGVCPGSLVAVIMEKSSNLYVSILAVLKIGAGYVPLVPELPRERTKIILSTAHIAACITDSSSPDHLVHSTESNIINLDEINLNDYMDRNIDMPYNGAHMAYAVFTSGSTGTPKGVLVTQDSLMSNLEYLSTIYPYAEDSRLLQSCSQAFDVSVFEIFFSWHVGICLTTARKDDLFSDLEGAINQLQVTHLSLTPTVAALINPDSVPRVKFLVAAGEPVTEHVRRKWAGRGLFNGYGPSELTNICTLRPWVSTSDLINNIGKPLDTTSAFVLDPKSENILPRGAVGELCFGGYQVFQGYLNQPDLTAAKIIDHPSYGRIYRTGDLGLMLADDSILFIARLDDQVKIRGQRVELEEISSTALDQECVQDCTTLVVRDSRGSELLVTFWVPASTTVSSFKLLEGKAFRSEIVSIFASLSLRLPSYMVPSHLVPISHLPMTTQGKVDKRVLQESFSALPEESKDSTVASDEVPSKGSDLLTTWEVQVANVLADTLSLPAENIRQSSSFFNLGLDSVSAIKFSSRLRKENLGDFTISAILKNPTIAHLKKLGETHKQGNHPLGKTCTQLQDAIIPEEVSRIQGLFATRDITISKIAPCTPLQEAMLSSGQSTAESSYSNVMVFSIKGDPSQLQQCWNLMVQRHEILRTAFVATNDPSHAYAQVVLQDPGLFWNEIPPSSKEIELAQERTTDLLQSNKPPVWLAFSRSKDSTRLLFCCHHAVYDGIAIQTLLKEVQDAYHLLPLPPPISYDNYLRLMLTQDLTEADAFWTAQFQGFEPTAFPSLTGKVSNRFNVAASWNHQLALPLSKVRELCQDASVTLLSVVHATWAKLLHFYTGESDICFGNVVSGRAITGHDMDRLVAPCFNTLPVRVTFDFDNENAALLQRLHTINIDSIAFQLTPLRRVQTTALKDGGRLFDTLVILQQPSEPLDDTIWTLEKDCGVMDMPLVCEVSQNDTEDRLDLTLHYHSTIASEKEAAIIAETFEASLAAILHHAHTPAHDTNGFPQHLRAEIGPALTVADVGSKFLHSGFENNVTASPDRIALDFLHKDGKRTTWSFQALNSRANSIAHELLTLGVKTEDIVPVHISKSPLFYASVLGVLKAGAAFVPVHPGLPEARKRLMIEDLGAKFILSTKEFAPPTIASNVVLVDSEKLAHATRENPAIKGLKSSNLAYCIFTSGSTGVPKAVSMEHKAPIQTVECSKSLVPWNTSSRLLQFADTTFDMCYYDCFLAWTLGFTLCAAEQDMMLNDLPKIINTIDADLLDLTPSVAASLIRPQVPKVKWLYCIGEAMTPQIIKEWNGACVNSYGPSEAAFCTTIFPVSHDVKPSVIGGPFRSTAFAIFPAHGDRPLPLLSTGELHIGGAQLAREYHGRPELTKEKFVIKSGQCFYRSGDMVRMLSDGNFEFIGRADDQVKIRGVRIELGEINNTLHEAHSDIETVVTQILKKDATAKEQLVAFLVMKRPFDEDEREQIRDHLRQVAKDRLSSYMVPQFFIFIEQIPRSMAGKIDKKVLTDIFRLSSEERILANGTADSASRHQWTTVQSQIRTVFAHLSNSALDDISPTMTIYQLGLDSISAVQIAAALRREGHSVGAADVMKYLTCTELAQFIERGTVQDTREIVRFDFDGFDTKHRPHVLASCHVADKDIVAVRPCTPLQRGMISQMLANEGGTYINYLRLELKYGTDINRMKEAWQRVMIAHQMLRTGFVNLHDKNHPFGMIEYASSVVALPWDTLPHKGTALTFDLWLAQLQREMSSEPHKPLWRIRATCEENTHYLDLAIFHGLFDAQSLQSIFQDVFAAYHCQNIEPSKDLNTVVDGILRRSTAYSEEGKEFWTQLAKQITPLRIPNLSPLRYKPQSPVVRTHRSRTPRSDIEDACRRSNTTLQAAGLASWLSLIATYTGETYAACGVVLSGRNFEIAENAVFPCINTVPVGHEVSMDMEHMLRAITKLMADVQEHQYIPLSDIQKMSGHSKENLFDTIFAYQKLPTQENANSLWNAVEEKATIEYPLSIELEPKGEHLEYRLTFMPHLIPQNQASLMLEQLDHILERAIFPHRIAKTFDSTLYSITPAKEPELPSKARFLHDFVELSAMNHPERIAFEFARSIQETEFNRERWTYSELDAEGNRVAHLLIANGVQPGHLVAVCFDKCPEASFAILGVLKAGAAFVAIDPGAPSTRQQFIIHDSGATCVLSMSAQSDRFINAVEVPVLNLDRRKSGAFPSTKAILARKLSPQDRSYCLYTSGTTGTPKGCELTHENAVQALLSFQRLFAGHWDSESRWLQFASFHFDVSVLEQFWSWSVGICVVSAPRDVIFEDLAGSISTLGITHIDLTPSLAQILHPNDVPSLCKGVFITGGESLKQEILDVWGPQSVIYNGYGPTEATIGCTMYPRVPVNGKPSNIGAQFDNVGSFVLRPGTDIPVLRGGIGELCVSGKLVGKGYLKRDDLTAKSFQYLDRFAERVYRTGDLVRILHDGTFDFLGRADDQVKLRGQRLELGEINTVIRQSNKKISDVTTLVLKHPQQQKEQLIAFIAINGQTNRQLNVLLESASETMTAKDACHDKLPPYMVPTHFVPLSSMPLNVNNKADAKQLKSLYESLSTADLQKLSSGPSQTDTSWSREELDLRHCLAKELDVDEDAIGKESNFFELGMDSILVIGVVRALRQAGFSGATASLLMKHSTLRRLTKALSSDNQQTDDRASILAAQQAIAAMQHRHRHRVAKALALSATDIQTLAPCTPLQQGMIAKSLESENGLYFNTFVFKLSKDIDHDGLEKAWHAVHASSQILRTVFTNTEDGYAQVVLRDQCCPWANAQPYKNETVNDCTSRLRREWLQRNSKEFSRPFEIHLLHAAEGSFLIVHIFHGLYDGISIELIFKAVWDVYNGRKNSDDSPTFLSSLPYGPLRILEGAKTFWQEHLSRKTSRSLVSSTNPSSKPVRVTRIIQNLSSLEPTRRKLNVTAQAIAQACWLHVLQNHIKAATTIGIVVSGRSIDLKGADGIIGPMFNTIPYQDCSQQNDSWVSIIKRVHDFNVAAHSYQHTPLRDIMKWCKADRTRPLFDILFVYQVAQADDAWAKNDSWELSEGDTAADYPLAFEVEQGTNGTWRLTLVVQSQVMDQAASTALLDRFEEALQQAIATPGARVQTLLEPNGIADTGSTEPHGTNGSLEGAENFVWTSDASAIRDLLAELTSNALEDINESTSIFELGLDSIDAIKLSSKLKNRGIDLPVSGIMRGLTITKMLPLIKKPTAREQGEKITSSVFQERKHSLKSYVQRQGFDTGHIEEILPVTPLQEAMVVEMTTSEFTRYYNFDVMQLEKDTDVDRLKAAWNQVVESTPILRTSFIEIDEQETGGSYAQMVHASSHQFWREMASDQEPDFSVLFDKFRKELAIAGPSSPPFNVMLVKSPGRLYLVLAIAHALYDGWSLGLLHADVKSAYAGKYSPRPSYQKTLSSILMMPESDASDFWGDYLDEAEPSTFIRRPTTNDETPDAVHRLERESTVSATSLADFAKKSNVSLQTLGQSAYAIVLASYVRSLDVTFGSVLSGRDDDTTSQIMFPTMNTVVIRTILHGNRTELLRHVQDDFTSLKQWQHYPLREALKRAGQHGGLFESLFIYQKSMEKSKDENSLYTSIAGRSDVEYPVCVEMEVIDNRLYWRCAVKNEVFDEAGAQELLNRLDSVLQVMMQQPDGPVIDFTSRGTSLCGLPPFGVDEGQNLHRSTSDASDVDKKDQPQEKTVSAIRKALCITASLPYEDMTDDMTIFHMGLDSISAIKVSSLLRQKHIILSVGDMLRAGTVINMARIADSRSSQDPQQDEDYTSVVEAAVQGLDRDGILRRANAAGCNIKKLQDVHILPATAGQVYMLSMWLNTRGSTFYSEFSYELRGSVSFDKLRDAWKSVVAANPILRTYFVATKDGRIPYVQLIRRNEEVEAHVVDTTGLAGEKFTTVQPWAHVYVAQSKDGWTLKLKIHHALYDGVSLPILMQQLEAICNSNDTHNSTSLATPVLEKLIASSIKSTTRKSFWKTYLQDMPARPCPPPPRFPNTRSEIFVPELTGTCPLEATARHNNISIQSLFLATLAKLHARRTSTAPEQDVVIGLYLANRSLPFPGVEVAAIPTVNLLPLRVRTPLRSSIVLSATHIQHDLQRIGHVVNATTGLWEIMDWTGVRVDVFVNFLSLPLGDGEDRRGDEHVGIVPVRQWTGRVGRVQSYENMVEAGDERADMLGDEFVNGAYLHAIDIEATVHNSTLDVGIFAPVEMSNLEAGNELLLELKTELENIHV